MRVDEWLARAVSSLITGADSPRLDAELLLMHVLEVNRTWLFTWPETTLTTEQLSQAEALLQRRLTGEPVAYLTGRREFWSLPLSVNPSTLIPRPDTETLVEWALDLMLPQDSRVLDLGTGTGAIALALVSEQTGWQVEATDLNPDAVNLARANASTLGLNVRVSESRWFSRVEGRFHLVVSNPPYIDAGDSHLREGDVRFEPLSALVADAQGLADLAEIIREAPAYLHEGGWLLLEHGHEQAKSVRELLTRQGFDQVTTRNDLEDRPRITGGQWRSEVSLSNQHER